MRKALFILAASLAIFSASSPATAQNVVADPAMIAKVMRDAGYRAEVEKASDGSPHIQSSSGGYPFRLFFFGCDADFSNCDTVQLFAGFRTERSPSLEQMNAFARDNRWGRVYIDQEDDPVIEMDIDLEDGGMSAALFRDNLEYWDAIMGKFARFAFEQD